MASTSASRHPRTVAPSSTTTRGTTRLYSLPWSMATTSSGGWRWEQVVQVLMPRFGTRAVWKRQLTMRPLEYHQMSHCLMTIETSLTSWLVTRHLHYAPPWWSLLVPSHWPWRRGYLTIDFPEPGDVWRMPLAFLPTDSGVFWVLWHRCLPQWRPSSSPACASTTSWETRHPLSRMPWWTKRTTSTTSSRVHGERGPCWMTCNRGLLATTPPRLPSASACTSSITTMAPPEQFPGSSAWPKQLAKQTNGPCKGHPLLPRRIMQLLMLKFDQNKLNPQKVWTKFSFQFQLGFHRNGEEKFAIRWRRNCWITGTSSQTWWNATEASSDPRGFICGWCGRQRKPTCADTSVTYPYRP